MSLGHSPKIVTDGLVFYYDMANTKKSWKGEPTTNLIPSPEHNGRFTTSNGWGTFSTNQYNGATYFSIGTIGSVTDNIVTLSSVGTAVQTFDVLHPQTSGGGLVGGTSYFVKRINSTQFSLHAYDGTSNGSHGYINPDTGWHKCHDSIALDQRIAINATSFPTMWRQHPHLSNSGLVKEVVEGVGPDGQSVMRLHVHKTNGTADGMAYGVYTPVTQGDLITVSYWQRNSMAGTNLTYSTWFGSGQGVGGGSYAPTDTNWHKREYIWTASTTFSFYQYFYLDASTTVPYYIDLCDLQVEVNKQNYPTPFVIGTRSDTDAIVDLVGNATVTASNLTYVNDKFKFVSANSNYLSVNGVSDSNMDDYTISYWIKLDILAGNQRWFANSNVGTLTVMWTGGDFVFHYNPKDGSVSSTSTPGTGWSFSTGVWYNVTATNDSTDATTGARMYINGDHRSSQIPAVTLPRDGQVLGSLRGTSHYGDGECDILQIYDRVLTADEVKQNFNAHRQRFGI